MRSGHFVFVLAWIAVWAMVLIGLGLRAGGNVLGGRSQPDALAQGSVASVVQEPACTVTSARRVHPLRVPLGGEIAVTTTVQVQCDRSARPVRLVLLVDASEEMADGRLDEVRSALERAIRDIDLERRPEVLIGVVSFSDRAQSYSPMTRDVERLIADLNNVRLGGQADLDEGIREAFKVLRAARGGGTMAAREMVLLVSSGALSRCDAARSAASELLERQDVVLTTACRGNRCLVGCLPDALQRYVYQLPTWSDIRGPIVDLLNADGPFAPVRRVQVHDELSPQLRYIGGDEPTGGIGNELYWDRSRWTADGITLTARAVVEGCGTFPSSEPGAPWAEIDFLAPLWPQPRERHPLSNPMLVVPCPSPTPSRTPTHAVSATPGVSATPSAPPMVSATPTAAVPRPPPTEDRVHHVWLPVAHAAACPGVLSPVDVVIVADVSGSMAVDDVPGFPSRWHAVRALTKGILLGVGPGEGLVAGVDRGGLVAFGRPERDQMVTLPLTPCCPDAWFETIDTFWKLNGSDLSAAMRVGLELFASTPPRSAQRVLVLITDGDLNQTDPSALDDVLDDLDNAAVVRYVIGVGSDVDATWLEALAGPSGRVARWADFPAGTALRQLVDSPRCRR